MVVAARHRPYPPHMHRQQVCSCSSSSCQGSALGPHTTVMRNGALAIAVRGLLCHRFMAELVIGHFQDLASSVLMAHIMAEREGSALPILDQVMLSRPIPTLWLGNELQERSAVPLTVGQASSVCLSAILSVYPLFATVIRTEHVDVGTEGECAIRRMLCVEHLC